MGRGTSQGNESISLSLHYREFYVDGVNVQQEDWTVHTDSGTYHHVSEIVDDGPLRFRQKDSSQVKLLDGSELIIFFIILLALTS